eukprot:scpid91136/ scgid19191/ 
MHLRCRRRIGLVSVVLQAPAPGEQMLCSKRMIMQLTTVCPLLPPWILYARRLVSTCEMRPSPFHVAVYTIFDLPFLVRRAEVKCAAEGEKESVCLCRSMPTLYRQNIS